jgi:hypothetical protein
MATVSSLWSVLEAGTSASRNWNHNTVSQRLEVRRPYLEFDAPTAFSLAVTFGQTVGLGQCLGVAAHDSNSCRGTAFSAVVTSFLCLHYPEIFIPSRQSLLLETGRSHSELNQGNRVCIPFK